MATLWQRILTIFTRSVEIDQPIDYEKDWEWVLSNDEMIALDQEKSRSSLIREELDLLNSVSHSIRSRPLIGTYVREYFRTLPLEQKERLLESRLDSMKRDRLIKDFIRGATESWKNNLLGWLPETAHSSFLARWPEQPYQKNICGEMASMAFRATHLAQDKGLTSLIVRDILWSIYICLCREIDFPTESDQNYLTPTRRTMIEESIIQQITLQLPALIDLWDRTTIAMGSISSREGRISSRWESEKSQPKIPQEIHARFKDGPNDLLGRNFIQSTTVTTVTAPAPISILSSVVPTSTSFQNAKEHLLSHYCPRK